jgi:hypothetical protein
VQNSTFFRLAGLCLLGSFFASCASVSVKSVTAVDPRAKVKPAVIYVTAFSTDGAKIKENPYRKHPGKLAEDSQQLLAAFLVDELKKAGLPATLVTSKPAKGNAWIIEGRLTRVEEGSRLLRMGLGLGLGGTKMETSVQIRNVGAAKPFLAFSTTGGSNAMPGAALSTNPISGTAAAVFNSKNGITDDSDRTARMITDTLAHYMVKHGLLKSTTVPAPKMGTE